MILNVILPLQLYCWDFSFALEHGASFFFFFFFGEIQHSPVNDCSAVSCNFGVLTGEDECTSFYSAIFKIAQESTKWYSYFERQLVIYYKTIICLPYNPAIAPIDIYTKELKTYVQTKMCIWMFILVTTVQTWKQPTFPFVCEWINKLQPIQTMEYYSPLKGMVYQAMEKHGRNLNAYH